MQIYIFTLHLTYLLTILHLHKESVTNFQFTLIESCVNVLGHVHVCIHHISLMTILIYTHIY